MKNAQGIEAVSLELLDLLSGALFGLERRRGTMVHAYLASKALRGLAGRLQTAQPRLARSIDQVAALHLAEVEAARRNWPQAISWARLGVKRCSSGEVRYFAFMHLLIRAFVATQNVVEAQRATVRTIQAALESGLFAQEGGWCLRELEKSLRETTLPNVYSTMMLVLQEVNPSGVGAFDKLWRRSPSNAVRRLRRQIR